MGGTFAIVLLAALERGSRTILAMFLGRCQDVRTCQAAVLVLSVVALGSVNSLHTSLLLDDQDIVRANPSLASPGKWLAILLPSERPARLATYRPLRELTFAADQALWGESARGRHVSSLLVYALGVLMFWALARRVGLGRSVALVATLWYALHAAHSEALGWAKNRGELLSVVFGLACLWACQVRGKAAACVAVACLLAALACMETAVCFAGVALVAAALAMGRGRRERMVRASVLVVVALAYVLWLTRVLAPSEGRPNTPTVGLITSAATALEVAGRYSSMALAPRNLCIDVEVGAGASTGQAWALVVAAALVVFALGRGPRAYGAALLLAPLALLAFLLVRDRPVAEHRALPCTAGVALCIGFLLQRSSMRRPSRAAAALVLLASCAMASLFVSRHFVWGADTRVWRDIVTKSPRLIKGRLNFAATCARDGLLTRADRSLRAGLAVYPPCPRLLNLSPPEAALREALRCVRQARAMQARPETSEPRE